MAETQVPVLYVNREVALPDLDQWRHRFEIESETSNRVYIISQHKIKKHWGCSCFGWRRYRKCKHLDALGIPGKETPYEPKVIQR